MMEWVKKVIPLPELILALILCFVHECNPNTLQALVRSVPL